MLVQSTIYQERSATRFDHSAPFQIPSIGAHVPPYTLGVDGCANRMVFEVFLGFLALGFGLLLHGTANPPLSCSQVKKHHNHPLSLLPLPSVDCQVQPVALWQWKANERLAQRGALLLWCLLGPMHLTNYRAYSWSWLARAFPEPRSGKLSWCSSDNYSPRSGPPWPCQAPEFPGEGGHNGGLPRLIPLAQGVFDRIGPSVAYRVIPCQLEGACECT